VQEEGGEPTLPRPAESRHSRVAEQRPTPYRFILPITTRGQTNSRGRDDQMRAESDAEDRGSEVGCLSSPPCSGLIADTNRSIITL